MAERQSGAVFVGAQFVGLIIAGLCMVTAGTAQAATQTRSVSSACVSDSGVSGTTWGTPANAQTSDDVEAETSSHLGSGSVSQLLKCTGFGFSLSEVNPVSVTGIEVEWEKRGSGSDVGDNAVRIVKGGVVGATDRSSVNDWPTTAGGQFFSYDSSDLWGETFSAADINSSGFGAAISAENTRVSGNRTPFVDSARITVTYSECGDGVQEAPEECDTGSSNGTTTCGCSSSCTFPEANSCTDDDLFCNGEGACDGAGACVSQGDPCSGSECNTCQEDTDSCHDPVGTQCSSDGNVCTDDVCDGSGGCGVANTAACDDGVDCTDNDACSGGTCQAGLPVDDLCASDEFCTGLACEALGASCPSDPSDYCRLPADQKSIVIVKDNPPKSRLVWKWLRGEATTPDALGDPTDMTTYNLCLFHNTLFDPQVSSFAVPPSGWSPVGVKGFKYINPDGPGDGITTVNVKSGKDGKARIIVKGGRGNLDVPLVPFGEGVAVELRNSLGECWSARFSNPLVNGKGKFKSKGS